MKLFPNSYLILYKARRVLQHHFVSIHGIISRCQSQTAQGVSASPILSDHRHDFVLDARGHGHLVAAYTDVCAPVNHSLRGTL